MPAWHEPATREIGHRIFSEVRGEAPMVDPDADVFNTAIAKALTPGAGALPVAAQMRARGARGQPAVDPEVAEFQVELGQRGKTMRTVKHEAHVKAKARAQGGEGRTDTFEPLDEEAEPEAERERFSFYADDDEDEDQFEAVEEDEYASLPEHIARHLRDDEEPVAVPDFTVPQLPAGDPYSALEGSLGYLSAPQLGELAVAVHNDPSLTAARRFELSERIGRVVAAR